jgi:hypothetical protein
VMFQKGVEAFPVKLLAVLEELMLVRVGFAILLGAALWGCDAVNGTGDLPDAADVPVDSADTADVALPPGCCRVDSDCSAVAGEGRTCAFGAFSGAGEAGACRAIPATGRCWDDGDCLVNEGCKGASFCPCDEGCGQAEALGTCKPLAGPGESCGSEGANCRPDLACCYPCGEGGCDWQCDVPCDATKPGCLDGCMQYP